MTDHVHPFRSSDEQPPNFICIVCWKGTSAVAGPCMACSAAPLLSVHDPEVVAEMRKFAQKRLARRRAWEWGVIFTLTGLVSLAFVTVLLVTGVFDISTRPHGLGRGGEFWPFFVPWFVLILVSGTYYPRVFKRSAMASTFDPETADLASLLEWIKQASSGTRARSAASL